MSRYILRSIKSAIDFVNYKRESNVIFDEIVFISINLLALIFFALLQLNLISINPSLYIRFPDLESFYLATFQVQATVITLSITVVSIISGVINTKYFGIQVTDYILNRRSKILRQKYLVVLNMFSILLNFGFCSLKLFNLCSGILIVSIFVCIRMFGSIYSVFSRISPLKENIRLYIISEALKDVSLSNHDNLLKALIQINENLEFADKTNDYAAACDNLELLSALVSGYFNKICDNSSKESRETLLDFLWDVYRVTNVLLESMNDRFFRLYLNFLTNILNKYSLNRISTNFWIDICTKIFYRLSKMDVKLIFAYDDCRNLRMALYSNITTEKTTWYGVVSFLASLYEALMFNDSYISISSRSKQQFWEQLVRIDTHGKTDYSIMTKALSLLEPKKEELNVLYKLLIDSKDLEILSAIFPIAHFEYIDLDLAILAYAYEAMNTRVEIRNSKSINFKALTTNFDMSSLSLNCLDDTTLSRRCAGIIHFLGNSWNGYYEQRNTSYKLSEFEAEFLFFYILYQLKELGTREIKKEISKHFDQKENELYRYYYHHNDYESFEEKYHSFFDFMLGEKLAIYEENCRQAFLFIRSSIEHS